MRPVKHILMWNMLTEPWSWQWCKIERQNSDLMKQFKFTSRIQLNNLTPTIYHAKNTLFFVIYRWSCLPCWRFPSEPRQHSANRRCWGSSSLDPKCTPWDGARVRRRLSPVGSSCLVDPWDLGQTRNWQLKIELKPAVWWFPSELFQDPAITRNLHHVDGF